MSPAVRRHPGSLGWLWLAALFGLQSCRIAAERGSERPPWSTGLDLLESEDFIGLRGRKIGIVANHTALDRRHEHLIDLAWQRGLEILALFAPEHGIRGLAEAGVQVDNERDIKTGLPVYSLYGQHRKPSREMLRGIDLLLFDIQDIGVRTYTYLSTLRGVLEAGAENQIEVWVLDRPNPLGAAVEGPLLEAALESFVGPHPVPLRYGLSIGEFARMMNLERGIHARLRVVPMAGWRRQAVFKMESGPWISPSPNIPSAATALLYAGFVLIEGTNLSEGRGTTRPFRVFGAPWLDALELAARLNDLGLPGVRFLPCSFKPSFQKFAGEVCQGLEVLVIDAGVFQPVRTAVAAIGEVRRRHPEQFHFLPEAFDRLAGTSKLREAIERGEASAEIAASWESDLRDYLDRRRRFLIYD